ncbi:MAG: cation-translocating P-type ATPase [Lachnospiraceae bacterium]
MTGLTQDEVKQRIEQSKTNRNPDNAGKTTKEIVYSNLFTYFNLVFTVLSILLIVVGRFRDLTFLPLVITNTLIGIIQQIRAKQTLDKLNLLHAPKATVLRDGTEAVIPVEELVEDDIILLHAGSQIPADAVLIHGEVNVNESLITGESDEIIKQREDELLSGSFVVSGTCYARLIRVGADSYASKLTMQAKELQDKQTSEMMRSLDYLVKMIGIIIIPVGVMLFLRQHYYLNLSIADSMSKTVAAIIGMIPEGLYLLASVALVVSVMRLGKQHILVHEMSCVETLARIDVLCVDKTGTITDPVITMDRMIPCTGRDGQELLPYDELKSDISDFIRNMNADNATMIALKEAFPSESGKEAVTTTSFSSATKYSSVTFEDGAYVLGAPEFVLREQYEDHRDIIEQYSQQGYRVLVYGRYQGSIDGKALTEPVTALAYLLLTNPIRKEARETFAYFAQQGVAIKVISGDNPVTVSKIAREAGIEHADSYVDASTLLNEADIQHAIMNHTVFGRVTPAQKRQFVKALKNIGHTVAMTGDGVNDVLALKDADCSIAMASGSDAASQVSQLVLLDSNFAAMPEVVVEGRRVVNNIERSASLFLVKNIFSFILSFLSIFFSFAYPILPNQIALINMCTIGTPAFFLALESNKNMVKGKFLTNVILRALPAAVTDLIMVGLGIILYHLFAIPSAQSSTMTTYIMLIVGFIMLFHICKPFNLFRRIVFGGMIGIFLFCFSIPFFRTWFGLASLKFYQYLIVAAMGILSYPLMHFIRKLLKRLQQSIQELRNKWMDYKLNH